MRSRERLNSSLLTADPRSVIYLWSLKELVKYIYEELILDQNKEESNLNSVNEGTVSTPCAG